MPAIDFFDLPLELRLQIYSELLVGHQNLGCHIKYEPLSNFSSSGPTRLKDHDNSSLHPEILRVCKQTYVEASPVLYSQNFFVFPHGYLHVGTDDSIAAFLAQIGSHTHQIRSISIAFPNIRFDDKGTNPAVADHSQDILDLIWTSCTALTKIELGVPAYRTLTAHCWLDSDSNAVIKHTGVSGALDKVLACLRRIASLERICVHFTVDEGSNLSIDIEQLQKRKLDHKIIRLTNDMICCGDGPRDREYEATYLQLSSDLWVDSFLTSDWGQ